ncbi:MAG TPA: hypothetical protein ENJ62_03375 [Bryobacterales bacterium]|nr:hypothetical protein [Bryobacterales bacterium]
MRILVTNPGGIGDFILRQPFLSLLLEHGHRLMVAVPEALAPLVSMAAPGADSAVLPEEPAVGESGGDGCVAAFRERVEQFDPELVVASASPPAPVEEVVAGWLPEVPSIASGCGDSSSGAAPFTRIVPAARNQPERNRYAALAAAILGWRPELPRPRLVLDDETRRRGAQELARLGFDPAACWIVCAGHAPEAAGRNWEPQQWADLLASLCRRHRLHLLFCGTPEEDSVTETVRESMGEWRSRTVNLCRQDPDLALLAGLLAHASGYIGRQTGPAHIAAALGKPVLVVAGAGDWPRSTVAADDGAVLLTLVPCAGCGWDCHLSKPYCVRQTPVEEVAAEFDRLISGEKGFRLRTLEPDRFLLHRLVEDGAALARERRRRLESRIGELGRERATLSSELASAKADLASLRDSLSRLERQAEELRSALKRAEEESARREFEARELALKAAAAEAEAAKLADVLQALKEENARLTAEPRGLFQGLFRSLLVRLSAKLPGRESDGP